MTAGLRTSELSEALLSEILSYCSPADIIQILETQDPSFLKATQLALSIAPALNCSFLLELDRCRNHGTGSKRNVRRDQEGCIVRLLGVLKNAKLERIELTGLRHVVGDQGTWLSSLFRGNLSVALTSIDFSGCAMLDPTLLHAALVPPRSNTTVTETTFSTTILHLNFRDCYRIDAPIVLAIAKSPQFAQLQSLGLGGCSQSIGDECIHTIIYHLRQLRHLDLSGLKHITEQASILFQFAPDTIESLELAGCELLRFTQLLAWGRDLFRQLQDGDGRVPEQRQRIDPTTLSTNYWQIHPDLLESSPPDARAPFPNLTRIHFNGLGTPRRGLVTGALPYFALRSMGALREVHLSGCEHIRDWEVEVLAVVCASSLTCLEMRACCIGDDAVRALGLHCTQLADVDFSACFKISDEGIQAFCQHQGLLAPLTMRSLKVAALPKLTNEAVLAIAALKTLILLDISNCPKVTLEALAETVKDLNSLVDVDARGVGRWSSSVAALYSYEDDEPRHLRYVNGRRFRNKSSSSSSRNEEENRSQRCIVREHAKRYHPTQGVPLQPMYHCLDCKLSPSLNRGMCYACMVRCHKGHRTSVGCYTMFYCDCPFGIAGKKSVCQARSCGHFEVADLVSRQLSCP